MSQCFQFCKRSSVRGDRNDWPSNPCLNAFNSARGVRSAMGSKDMVSRGVSMLSILQEEFGLVGAQGLTALQNVSMLSILQEEFGLDVDSIYLKIFWCLNAFNSARGVRSRTQVMDLMLRYLSQCFQFCKRSSVK